MTQRHQTGDGRSDRVEECLAMQWLHLVSCFFGAVFLTNALPHFVSGAMGMPFQSPFARPPGQGLSSSTVNVLWGFFNIAVFYVLVFRTGDFDPQVTADAAAFGLGMLAMGLIHARLFGRFHGGNAPEGGEARGPRSGMVPDV
jgi:hypothetical protein